MEFENIIEELSRNQKVFEALLKNRPAEQIHWRTSAEKWSLLEIICHLRDEEIEDFRARAMHVLIKPEEELPSINPTGWVLERKYAEQDYQNVLQDFLQERHESIVWLKSLDNPNWNSTYNHPKLGAMTAWLFLNNWLAHDYLHIRQINRMNYEYFLSNSDVALDYAGAW